MWAPKDDHHDNDGYLRTLRKYVHSLACHIHLHTHASNRQLLHSEGCLFWQWAVTKRLNLSVCLSICAYVYAELINPKKEIAKADMFVSRIMYTVIYPLRSDCTA